MRKSGKVCVPRLRFEENSNLNTLGNIYRRTEIIGGFHLRREKLSSSFFRFYKSYKKWIRDYRGGLNSIIDTLMPKQSSWQARHRSCCPPPPSPIRQQLVIVVFWEGDVPIISELPDKVCICNATKYFLQDVSFKKIRPFRLHKELVPKVKTTFVFWLANCLSILSNLIDTLNSSKNNR